METEQTGPQQSSVKQVAVIIIGTVLLNIALGPLSAPFLVAGIVAYSLMKTNLRGALLLGFSVGIFNFIIRTIIVYLSSSSLFSGTTGVQGITALAGASIILGVLGALLGQRLGKNVSLQTSPKGRDYAIIFIAAIAIPVLTVLVMSLLIASNSTVFIVPQSSLGHYCKWYVNNATPICNNVTFSTQGKLSFTFTGGVGDSQVAFACSTQPWVDYSGPLPPANTWMRADSTGKLYFSNLYKNDIGSLSVRAGASQRFSGLVCYKSDGTPVGNVSKGTVYTGYVWRADWGNLNGVDTAIPIAIAVISVNAT